MTAITLKKIDGEILSFSTNRDKLRDQASAIGLLIFYHAAPKEVSPDCQGSGDCTRAIKLVKAMPKSWAPQMQQWFKEFTPIRMNIGTDRCEFDPKYKKLDKADKLDWWKLEEASAVKWFELSEEPDVKTVIMSLSDLLKMAAQLGKRIEKIASDDDERRVIKPEDKEAALAFARLLEGIKIEPVKPATPANSDMPEEVAA